MKKYVLLLSVLLLFSTAFGCCFPGDAPAVVATTLPVYEFASSICQGTNLQVVQLITESVSCLHDYTLQVSQMRTVESAQAIILSGAGLEDFMGDILPASAEIIDASEGIHRIHIEQDHMHEYSHDHSHEQDPHIWLSPANAKIMAKNICAGLSRLFPENDEQFSKNLAELSSKLDVLEQYGADTLSELSCRELVTFHDGFAYFAGAFDLHILRAVEEESGSKAAASEIIEIAELVYAHKLPAIFTECDGSTAAASIIHAETGVPVFELDMVISGSSYFEAMYHNIDTLKEALE